MRPLKLLAALSICLLLSGDTLDQEPVLRLTPVNDLCECAQSERNTTKGFADN